MKRPVTGSNPAISCKRQVHALDFTKVLDGRKQPIRGLWVRNRRYYARLAIEDGDTGNRTVRRVALVDKENKPVGTVPQAVDAMRKLMAKRSEDDLPVLHRTPKFADFAKTYLAFIKAGAGQKKPRTILKEGYTLKGWTKHLGGVRLDKIRMVHVNAYTAKRLNAGVSPRTVNLDVIALNAVLKHAIDEKWIKSLPTANRRPLKCAKKQRALFSCEDLAKLCKTSMDTQEDGSPVTKNGQQFCDYVRLLSYCGAREQEALSLRWRDVDFERGQLTIGAMGDTKNSTARTVDFNPKLGAHLEDMATRRAPDSQWLFPSPQRGDRDNHAQTFRESLKLVRKRAGMVDRAFHDLRHHFISYAVMAGVDYMTIAAWVGHRDGGVLIGKVYGHLANEHKKAMAEKLNFEPALLEKAENE
jgi:integrase